MVSIIKNQLLKHLSRFTKNLSADKINISTFKGEGELSNLELNEIVLTDLLELPSFLRLTKAWCNKVTFRISWTKLKSVPILLNLDEVNIIIETCEELRPTNSQANMSSYTVPGKYSFIHKVIDGITVSVNNVNITFNSPAFTASVQITRIMLESKTFKWEHGDLRFTRLKDPSKGQVLIFKELEWQAVKIEAQPTKNKNLSPLRLITTQARCRIVIKKRLSDCFIMGSRLVMILDDLLWVLTDAQLKAALHFVDSLSGLIQKATQITRKAKAARKLQELPEYQAQCSQESSHDITASKFFGKYDVIETSYHFLSNQVVLHFCDDPGAGRSSHPNLKDGGALQINIRNFQADYFPYHLAKASRKHWPTYSETAVPHAVWQEQALLSFKNRFLDLVNKNKVQHTPLTRSPKQPEPQSPIQNQNSPDSKKPPSTAQRDIKRRIELQLAKLMTSSLVLRLEDFIVYKVATTGKKHNLKEFISGDRDHMMLPKEASIVHAEFIYYYYPSDIPFPLPPPKFYAQLNPIQIVFDLDTCLWLNAFGLNLYQSLMTSKADLASSNYTYIDVKIEAILPRMSFESNLDYPNQKDRPKSLNFQVTRVTVTNIRSLEQSSRADLAKCVDSFQMGSLFFGSDFPSQSTDFHIVTQKFLDHIAATDNIRAVPSDLNFSCAETLVEQLSRELLWTEAKDVWCINLDPVWGDFLGAKAIGVNKPVAFLDAVPVTVWLHSHMDPNSTIKTKVRNGLSTENADVHALIHISNLISVQINHYQFLFLLRLAEEVTELATFLIMDTNKIMGNDENGSLILGALIPQLEVTFVMPAICPGKESSGGDIESFVPDTSSLADDMPIGSSATVWQASSLSMMQGDYSSSKPYANNIGRKPDLSFSQSMDFAYRSSEVASPLERSPQHNPSKMTLQNNLNEGTKGISSMRKGFSNFMSSIDSALKSSPDDVSDTVSLRSDSSDSEINLMNIEDDLNMSDLMFFNRRTLLTVAQGEIATEAAEEASSITTTSGHSASSSGRRKDLVSVSTFKLHKVEFLQQSAGTTSCVKVQVSDIYSEDCSSIPWDEFQTKFSSRSRGWSDNPLSSSVSPKVRLRLDHNLMLPSSLAEIDLKDKNNLRRLFEDLLAIKVKDLDLDLTMTTAIGLADLAEDEVIQPAIPMQIFLDNVQLHLIEDRPPVNITSPGPIPIDLSILKLFITRKTDGVFCITPPKADNSALVTSLNFAQETGETFQKLNKQLSLDNEELRRRLAAFERISEENRVLRKAKEERDVLKACLTSTQDEVGKLLDEKQRLLDDVKRLQDLVDSDRGRHWNNKR